MLNVQYFREFQDIANNTLGVAYFGRHDAGYLAEKLQMFRDNFEREAGKLVREMKEEYPPVDEKISRLISACYNRWISANWKLEKLERQMDSATRIWERRVKSIGASYIIPKDRVF